MELVPPFAIDPMSNWLVLQRHASLALAALLLTLFVPHVGLTRAAPLVAQVAPVIESLVAFDDAGRVTVVTPTLAARLGLTAPAWPVTTGFREARLYLTDSGTHVLSVQRIDGSFARYALSPEATTAIRRAITDGVLAQGRGGERFVGTGTGLDVSQPAGNTFVRNQTVLGLLAYGPATSALLSSTNGAVAGGGYLLAAGTSFFVAANLGKHRTITRAQASRTAHGGTRGALTGLGLAALIDTDGAPARGALVLGSAVGGSMAGFHHARGLSDGEAASAGLFADLGAVATGGIGGAAGAFRGRTIVQYRDPLRPEFGTFTRTDNTLRNAGKATIAAAIGANIVGYTLGPRYAQRAGYNVTAGDVTMVFTSALLGAAALGSLPSEKSNSPAVFGAATVGLLGGAWLADRGFVRGADRTSADGTLAQLGAAAGALMGAGVATLGSANGQVTFGLASAGGLIGLLAADQIIKPARDAGPLRGVMQSTSRALDGRLTVSFGPLTAVRFTF
jgi:hypothetical protein